MSFSTVCSFSRPLDGNIYELDFVLPRGKELEMLRAERNEYRGELNQFRKELHDFRTALLNELRELYDEYTQRLSEIYSKEANAFCELRDKSGAEIEEQLARLEKAK